MVRRYSQFLELMYFLIDIILLVISYFLALWISYDRFTKIQDKKYFILLIAIGLIWFFVTTITNYYKSNRRSKYENIVLKFARVWAFQILFTFAYIVVLKGYSVSRELLMYTYGIFFVLDVLWKIGFETYLKKYRAKGGNYRRIIVIGANRSAQQFVQEINEHSEFGYRFMGYFTDAITAGANKQIAGSYEDVKWYCFSNNIDEVYCAVNPSKHQDYINDLMAFCDDNLIRFRIIPEFTDYLSARFKKLNVEYYGSVPVITSRPEPLDNFYNRILKRSFDIAFSIFFMLVIGIWLFPIIAILVKFSSKGPVFFKQKRSGEGNREFLCYKFRTMYVNKEADTRQATKDDPRITRVGRILRKTNLDELPQFINVLLGEMSVVGPRPHMLKHTEEYSKIVNSFMVRHFVKPGITGAAQAKGYRGDTTDPEMMRKRVQYDVWYLENWSFWLDVKIVFLTIWSMLKGNENAV